jgi:hypothetical protein
MRLRFALIALALDVTGCSSSLYTIKDTESAGIPFFPIRQMVATTEVRAERWWELQATVEMESIPNLMELEAKRATAEKRTDDARKRLEAEKTNFSARAKAEQAAIDQASKEIDSISKEEQAKEEEFRKTNPPMKETLTLYFTDQQKAAELLLAFNSKDAAEEAWDAVRRRFLDPKELHTPPEMPPDAPKDKPGFLLTIERKRIQTIDKNPRYLNVDSPWFGTSSATVSLAQNGTLSSVQAQRDPQVAALVTATAAIATASLTPLATVAAAKLAANSAVDAAKATAAGAVAAAQAAAQLNPSNETQIIPFSDLEPHLPKRLPPHVKSALLKSTEYVRKYSCTTESERGTPAPNQPSDVWCRSEAEGVSYKIEVVRGEDKSKDEDDAGKAISITGKIQLPKAVAPPEK